MFVASASVAFCNVLRRAHRLNSSVFGGENPTDSAQQLPQPLSMSKSKPSHCFPRLLLRMGRTVQKRVYSSRIQGTGR